MGISLSLSFPFSPFSFIIEEKNWTVFSFFFLIQIKYIRIKEKN